MVKCLHKRSSNTGKSRKLRRQWDEGMDADTVLRERLGAPIVYKSMNYSANQIDNIFSSSNRWISDEKPLFYVVGIDPSHGGQCKTGLVGGFMTSNFKRVICTIDVFDVQDYKDYKENCIKNLLAFHEIIRKDRSVPIIVVVESQGSGGFNGAIIKEAIEERLNLRREKALERIHILKDEKKKVQNDPDHHREGVNATKDRQDRMVCIVRQALARDDFMVHTDVFAVNPFGLNDNALPECKRQLKAFDLEKKSGKVNGQQDDVADAFHIWALWENKLREDRFYSRQLKALGVNI